MSVRLLLAGVLVVALVPAGGVAALDTGSSGYAQVGTGSTGDTVDSTASATGYSSHGPNSDATATRAVNTTEPRPGATVRVTTTITLDSERTVDLVDEFDPEFASTDLVSVRLDGTEISPDLQLVSPGDILVSVENVGPGTLEFVYDVTVPANAPAGQTHTLDGVLQVDDNNIIEMDNSTVAVTPPTAEFAVGIDSVDRSVVVGESLSLAATVTNTGDATGTQTVSFAVDGGREGSEELTVAPGANETVTFAYETVAADRPAVNLTVASENETATAAVDVLAPNSFAVGIDSVDGSVVVGENVSVAATVTNTGDVQATQTVSFAVDGGREGSEELTLAGGENATLTFTYRTGGQDTPEIGVAVASENETATATVAVLAPASFGVDLTAVEDPVVVGENTTVEARVTNEGDVGGTQEVTFAVDGERQGGERVTLAGGENVTLAFSYETETGDRPEVEVAVASENETATAAVEVSAPASFAVAIDTVDDAVTIGENLTVTARVANEGDVTGTQEVAFAVDGGREGGERVTVAPGANETVTFAYETVAADRPAVNLTVASENETATATVAVLAPASFGVALTAVEGSVVAGENLTVTARVTNEGTTRGTQEVAFAVDGGREGSERVTLAGGENVTLAFSYETETGDRPEVEVAVASENETATAAVAVLAPASFGVDLSVENSVVVGETVTAEVIVTNEGEARGTQELSFTVDGDQQATTELTLDGSAGETLTFTYETGTGDTPEIELSVASGNETATTAVAVLAPASFGVDLSVGGSVRTGETVTVEAAVTNEGNLSGTRAVGFLVGGTQQDSLNLTLDGGESETLVFSYATDGGDPLDLPVTVSTGDAVAREIVSVVGETTFAVSAELLSDTVQAGTAVRVEYTVENLGTRAGTQTVTVTVAGETLSSERLTLGAGETAEGTAEYTTTAADAPLVGVTVASSNDTADRDVTVATAAALAPTDIEHGGPVVAGDTLPVTVTVDNSVDTSITGPLTLVVTDGNGEQLATLDSTVSIDADATEQVAFEYVTGETDLPSVTLRAETPGNLTAPVVVGVEEPPQAGPFKLSVEAAGSVVAGESVTLDYTVTNTGGAAGTVTVESRVGETDFDSETVTVPADGSVTGSFDYPTTRSDIPSVTLSVTAGETSTAVSVSVETTAESDDTDSGTTADGDGTGFGAAVAGFALLLLCSAAVSKRVTLRGTAR